MNCLTCERDLVMDEIALNKKLLGRKIERFLCLTCLARQLECTEEALRLKIEEFRKQGCRLFSGADVS